MKITVEVSNMSEIETIFTFFQTINIENIHISTDKNPLKSKIEKGNKKLNPQDLFGIWKDSPKNIEEIRATAWKRN